MDDRTERLLHELALGERHESDTEAVALLERVDAREHLAGLRATLDALDAARRERALDLAAPPTTAEAAFVEACRARVGASAHPLPEHPFAKRIAAAAVLVGLGFLGWQLLARGPEVAPGEGPAVAVVEPAPDVPQRPASLGAHGLECTAPVGTVERYGTFRWDGTLEPGESYDLLVTDRTRPDARPRTFAEDLLDPFYEPTEAERATLPEALTWTVRVRGADGRPTERSTSADASRR